MITPATGSRKMVDARRLRPHSLLALHATLSQLNVKLTEGCPRRSKLSTIGLAFKQKNVVSTKNSCNAPTHTCLSKSELHSPSTFKSSSYYGCPGEGMHFELFNPPCGHPYDLDFNMRGNKTTLLSVPFPWWTLSYSAWMKHATPIVDHDPSSCCK